MNCCPKHIAPSLDHPGWCSSSFFDGCEPCCQECPDYDWCGLWGCLRHPDPGETVIHFCGRA